MQRLAALASLLILMGFVHSALALPCTPHALADHTALASSGCSVGNLSFSQFSVKSFHGAAAMQIAPTSVIFSPIPQGLAITSASALGIKCGGLAWSALYFSRDRPGSERQVPPWSEGR